MFIEVRFLKRNSYIHRTSPVLKIFIFTLIAFLIIYLDTLLPLILIFLFLLFITLLSRLGIIFVFKELKIFILISLLIFIIFSLLTSYLQGFIISFRVFLFIFSASIFTLTTSSMDLTKGMKKILKPLKIIKFLPIEEFIIIFSLSLRFLPIIMEEIDKIMKAKISRGSKDFSILIPLFHSTLRRTEELTEALEARCYRVKK